MSDAGLDKWLYGRLHQVREVPRGWRLRRLTDVARLESGHTPARGVPSYWNGDIRWLSLHDTSKLDDHVVSETRFCITPAGVAHSAARVLPAGTVALSRTATVGKCVILGRDMATTQDFACYVPGPHLYAKYLMHLFRFMQPVWRALAGGSTHQTVYMPVFENLQTLLPPVAEQRQIAEILDTVDEAIRRTEEIIAKLERVKQGLLHDLLTRGIDDNGELRDPDRHPEQFKDSPLGRIPKSWTLTPAGALCSLITKGTTPSKDKMWEGRGDVRFLRVDNLTFDGSLDLTASNFRVSRETHCGFLSRSRLAPGDVLTNIVGPPLGKLGLVPYDLGEANVNQAIAIFRPAHQIASSFLLWWLAGAPSQSWLRSRAKRTSGQVNLTLRMCQELPVPFTNLGEQSAIVDRLDAVRARLESEHGCIAKLRVLKGGLLEDLLTGRVRVTKLLETAAE